MTDLATTDAAVALERASDPGEFVVLALERGKSWLAEALAHGDLDQLVNVKGYAETLRVATVQKQLGKDAVLSAQELVRRAERCIGLGVRQGQQEGHVSTRADVGPLPDYVRDGRPVSGSPRGLNRVTSKTSPSEYFGHGEERADIYAVTDDVSDDEFEEAIAEAKTEGNLSRANVVRKVKPERAKPKPADRSEWNRGRRRIDPERIVEQTVIALSGLALGLDLIDDYTVIDAEKRLRWLEALREPLAAINRMKKGLSG